MRRSMADVGTPVRNGTDGGSLPGGGGSMGDGGVGVLPLDVHGTVDIDMGPIGDLVDADRRPFGLLEVASLHVRSAMKADEDVGDLYGRLSSLSSSDARSVAHSYRPSSSSSSTNSNVHVHSNGSHHSTSTTSGHATSTSPSSPPKRSSPGGRHGSPWDRPRPPTASLSNASTTHSHTSIHTNSNSYSTTSIHTNSNTNTSTNTSSSCPTTSLVYEHTVSLPRVMTEGMGSARRSCGIGLLAEAGLVWMSVDSTLYLWAYEDANSKSSTNYTGDLCSYVVPSGRDIVSVGLVRPKKGVFKADLVEWCLVVTTDDEIVVCAVTTRDVSPSSSYSGGGSGGLRLIPTRFVTPTDGVLCLVVRGTPDGRVYLGGHDGCLYELDYGASERKSNGLFFSSSLSSSSLIAGAAKRALQASNLLPSSHEVRPHKCRRLNRSSGLSFSSGGSSGGGGGGSLFEAGFLGRRLFGGDGGGPMVDVAHDAEREVVWTLSARGTVRTLHYHNPKHKNHLYNNNNQKGGNHKSSGRQRRNGTSSSSSSTGKRLDRHTDRRVDLTSATRAYLQAVALGRVGYSSSVRFPGGTSVAAAGVGGTDHARSLLQNEAVWKSSWSGVGVLSERQSRTLGAVVWNRFGIRCYLDRITLALCYVRCPPPLSSVDDTPHEMEALPHPMQPLQQPQQTPRLYPPCVPPLSLRSKAPPTVAPSRLGPDGRTWLWVRSGAMDGDTYANQRDKHNDDTVLAVSPVDDRCNLTNPSTSSSVNMNMNLNNNMNHNNNGTGSTTDSRAVTSNPAGGGGWDESVCRLVTGRGGGGRIFDVASMRTPHKEVRQTNADCAFLVYASTVPEEGTDEEVPDPPPPHRSSRTTTGGTGTPMGTSSSTAILPTSSWASTAPFLTLLYNQLGFVRPTTTTAGRDPPSSSTSNNNTSTNIQNNNNNLQTIYRKVDYRPSEGDPPPRPVVPLDGLAVHHWNFVGGSSTDRVAVLDRGGVHVYRTWSVLNGLARALADSPSSSEGRPLLLSPETTRNDPVATFFATYGPTEGCAMALALAVQTTHQGLRRRAVEAALAHGHRPLVVGSPVGGGIVRPSALYGGLVSLVGRLLRPFWWSPALTVTTEPMDASKTLTTQQPKRVVRFLLSPKAMETFRRPLAVLVDLFRRTFAPAVSKVPRLPLHQPPSHAHSHTPQYHHLNGNGNGIHPTKNTYDELARGTERMALHCLYRLVSRTSQLLSLLSVLRRVSSTVGGGGGGGGGGVAVEWSLLHRWTYRGLVTHPTAHERIRSVLSLAAASDPRGLLLADHHHLERQYLFFGMGERLAGEGFRAARAALITPSSDQRTDLANRAATCLRRAARYWNSPGLVLGTSSHHHHTFPSQPQQGPQGDGPLERAAEALMQISHVGGVVDVCLSCAANFGGTAAGTEGEYDNTSEVSSYTGTSTAAGGGTPLPWEKENLYHQPSPHSAFSATDDNNPASSSSGVMVTVDNRPASSMLEDARHHCYGVLLGHLLETLRRGANPDATTQQGNDNNNATVKEARSIAVTMLAICAHSADVVFLHRLYEAMVDEGPTGIQNLLRIEGPELESWLKRRLTNNTNNDNDHLLYWRYLVVHSRRTEAAAFMIERACSTSTSTTSPMMTLDGRIECLTRALPDPVASSRLRVARLQRRVLTSIPIPLDTDTDSPQQQQHRQELSTSLIGLSDLYNRHAAPMGLYDLCLAMVAVAVNEGLHSPTGGGAVAASTSPFSVSSDITATVQLLWKCLLCRELRGVVVVPSSSSTSSSMLYSKQVETTLRRLRADTPMENDDDDEDLDLPRRSFEDATWLPGLIESVVRTGIDLREGVGAGVADESHQYGNYGSSDTEAIVVPLKFLVEHLEQLRALLDNATISTDIETTIDQDHRRRRSCWALQCFIDMGIPYLSILEAYNEVLEEQRLAADVSTDARVRCLANVAEVLMRWVQSATSDRIHASLTSSALTLYEPPRSVFAHRDRNPSAMQLSVAISSGLRSRIDSWKEMLESLEVMECGHNRHAATAAASATTTFLQVERILAGAVGPQN